ncbi:MAG: neuraminidase-like domain-containing protein [Thermodesulfobacteriota bacterium]
MTKQNKLNYLVQGKVSDKLNRPLTNLLVQAFDRDMRSEELLGKCLTNEKGEYKIYYSSEQFARAEKKSADLAITVLTAKSKTVLYITDMDAIRFNASEKEEINIVIEAGIPKEENEFDSILRDISPLIETVKVSDLQENDEHRDITFLSSEAGITGEKLEHMAVAHRLSDASKMDAAFFYALLRKNTLLKNDFAKSFHARLVIGINTEILPLLYDAALADEKLIKRDVEAAVKEMVVPDRVLKELKKHLEQLKAYRKKAEAYYRNEHPRKVLNLVSRFVLSNKISELNDEFQKSKNDLGAFLNKITSDSFFKTDVDAKEATTNIALAEVMGFNEAILSHVREAKGIDKPEDIKKLASMNKADWKETLTKSAGKINVAGKPLDKKLVDYHASLLVRKMERLFPSVAYVAQLQREKKPFLKNHYAVKNFMSAHEDFDLQKTNLDLFLKKKKLDTKENDAMRNELKSVQRVFKLIPHYSKSNVLLQNKIHSAQSIVATGETRFVKEIAPKAGISKKEAELIYKKAENVHTASMLIVGELQDTIRTMDVPALRMESLSAKLEAVSKDFPNLKSLFQLTDMCACEHCRSVYSPAAYLVELLQFLDKRSVTDITVVPPTTGHLAKDVLFERRPDLGDIDLSCENANTPLPYIDLVCELLEEAVAPDPGVAFNGDILADPTKNTGKISNALLTVLHTAKIPVTDKALIFETETASGPAATLPHYLRDTKAVCKIIHNGANNWTIKRLRQTLSSAEELAASPEYVNEAAYTALNLPANAYAFKLPFDLDHTEAKAYFSRFGISRADLMRDFQTGGNPADDAIAAEKLGLTEAERKLIVTPDTGNQQLYWNTAPLSAVDEMKVVDTFLTKSGLAYQQLDLLLSLRFIDPNDNLFIKHLDLSCDTAQKEIANLDDSALDRIHRFLRLQKKTGWKFETLDEIIWQSKLGNRQLDNNCVKVAATLQKLVEQTGIKLEEWLCCFGEFPHTVLPDVKSTLYDSVFQNKAANRFIEEGLSAANVAANEVAVIKKPLTDFKTTIAVCLHVTEQDFDKLLPSLPNGDLSFANLSTLYAISKLIRKLKLKTDDYLILKELTGLDVFSTPAVALQFVEAVTDSRLLPLKLADVKFMLRHEAFNLADREMKDEKITSILSGLQAAYQKSFITNRSPYDDNLTADEQKESLQALLSKLSGVSEDDVKTFLNFTDRNWTSLADSVNFINSKLSSLFDTTQIVNKLNALAVALGPDFEPERKDLIKAILDTASDFFFKSEKQSALLQTLSSSFKTNTDTAGVILKSAKLKKPAPGTSFISDLLLTDALIDKVNTPPVLPALNSGAFPDQYRSLRLLHKLFPLIASFRLEDREIDWLLMNNVSLGWFEFDKIPYQAGQTAVAYNEYAAFAKMLSLANRLTPVPNPSDAQTPLSFYDLMEMLLPGSTTTRAQWIDSLSLLTGYDKDTIDAIDNHFGFSTPNLNDYRNVETWRTIENCAEYLRKMGATVDQVKEFIKPVLEADDAHQLRMTLKARYDEDLWLDTLKEIMNAIRPQKRDALVAYLLATNPTMKDENDLFDYFLVDVEMESCMPSSRIVQAHGTIQLFVQRCLMGLEPEAAADVNNDKSWNQWKWMKNYRVWEANRKVFLYPENWIEAELRDDKSFLFKELENELLQNEVNEFTTEDALIRYMEKLDDIAFLEVVATWYQTDIYTMHVFARTKGGDPPIYYYRRFEKERYWTPWEKVDLDITSDHLLAFVRNNRLNLAWPVFSEEPDPNQKASTPDINDTSEKEMQKVKRKLKIQLAISEFANKKWKPRKISKDAIKTPPSTNPEKNDNYTSDDIPRENFKFFYNQFADQIVVFNLVNELQWVLVVEFQEQQLVPTEKLAGAFDIAGCKGYPELAPAKPFTLNFIPRFRDTNLLLQRFKELGADATDDLSVLNVHAYLTGKSIDGILQLTPGTFRITYPHQFTNLDLLVLLFEFLMMKAYGLSGREKGFLWPLGTLLPYFMEDSNHAYVIIPGFYDRKREGVTEEIVEIKRTASDALKLIEDIIALFNEYLAKYNADPAHNINTLIQELLADPEYQKIIAEIRIYGQLHYGEQFKNMYHSLICPLRTTLYKYGVAELMKRETQLIKTDFDFFNNYVPNTSIVPKSYTVEEAGVKMQIYPREDLDFSADGSYSGYNWEMFFHVPFLLATRLSKNQRFEEAMVWFHYMFNPTGALEGNSPEKYWVTKPFYQTHVADYINQRIDTLLYKIADPTTPEKAELEFAIEEWRDKPFKPHVVARFRPVAYQKSLLMKYIGNLTEWGDYLFRQDTMESIAQATQMYILADKLLGPKPRIIPPPVKPPYETYSQIEAKLDAFGNALIDLENILPDFSVLPEGGAELPAPPVTLSMLYFCIPQNDKMLEYWDRIADRLFKIRHCQNIDGVERTLALFAPPIDPGMLVRAAAAGLDISSVLAGLSAPTPYYRFNVLSQKATELVQEVRGLGSSLLQALEKKDAEALSLLRSELELKVLKAVRDMKLLQIKEAKEQIEILKKTKAVTEERNKYYTNIEKIIPNEQLNLDKLQESHDFQTASQIVQAVGGILALIPDFKIGAHGVGGSPAFDASFGGTFLSRSASAAAGVLNILSSIASYEASRASILGGYDRRFDDWKLQERLAKKELAQIEKQIAGAEIRKEISETDLRNHDLQIENAQKTDEFMRSKFTNKELYEWMIGQVSSVYFRAYQLAHDFAKKAERCYQHELGSTDAFIEYGYWDSLKKGLQSADHLFYDVKRLETSYLDKNKREYELTKHVSLAMLDPLALARLKATGVCDFEIPEALFDMDHPGHFFRRIKSVSISLPCIVGPYTSVSAKLSLISNKYRKNTNPDNAAATGYTEDLGNDERFVYNVGAIQSVAASSAQNDSGLFEMNIRDERYLPFEGCGAISTWRLELPAEVKQFDYNTISDVLLHVKYTAREGGSTFRGLAESTLKEKLNEIRQQLAETGLHLAFNIKQDMPNEWYKLKKNGSVNLQIDKSRLPYFVQSLDVEIDHVTFIARVKNNPASFTINIDGATNILNRKAEWQLCLKDNSDLELDTSFQLSIAQLQLDKLEDLMMVVKYILVI